MRVLVAGGNGFLGSHVVRELIEAGHEVIALVGNRSDLTQLEKIAPLISFMYYDRQSMELTSTMSSLDAVVNAVVCYGRGEEGPSSVVEGNILFPLRLLEIVAVSGCRTFLTFGTYFQRSRSYGILQPYILSKRHFLEYARPVARKGGIRLVNLALEHVYGPGDSPDKFVPGLVKDCLAGVHRIPMTPGEQVRDFVHVNDVARACVTVLERSGNFGLGCTTLEVGSGRGVSIRSFAELVLRQCGGTTQIDFGALPYRKGEIMTSVADTTRLNKMGWRAQISLQEGIAGMIAAQGGGRVG